MKNPTQLIGFVLMLFSSSVFAQTVFEITTPGPGTWTVPCGVTSITVDVYGGGGGGGGANSFGQAGGGGGAGGWAQWTFVVVPGSTFNYTVGAGGNGGGPAGNGAAGSQSNWDGGILFALGGAGGFCENNGGGGGAGGTASAWATNATGGNGTNGLAGGGGSAVGGIGGNNFGPLGGTGGSGGTVGNNGANGGIYGAGGGGGGGKFFGSNTRGGDGANGAIVLTYTSTDTQPAAGPDQSDCSGNFTLAANSPDPGYTAVWSLVSGTATIVTPASPTSTVTGIPPGTCATLRWSFSKPGCATVYDEINLCAPITRTLFVGNDCNNAGYDEQNNFLHGAGVDVGLPMNSISPGDYPCAGSDLGQNAFWVDFNSVNNTTLTFSNAGPVPLDYTLFSGTCGSKVYVSCNTAAAGGSVAVPVTANTNYMVMITGAGANDPTQAYLCITGANIYMPSNDNCVNAFALPTGVNVELSNSNATVDLNNTLCSGTTENNIWLYWVADFTGTAYLNLQNQDCIMNDGMQMSVFNADANCPTSSSTCILYINPANNNDFFGSFPAVAGSTYYIQLDGYAGTGCSFDFCITPFNGVACNTLTTLPVDLLSFTADLRDNTVELQWSTASESNSDYFIIDRSINGEEWVEISNVKASGFSTVPRYYGTYDYSIRESGTYYYRLTQVDFDGKYMSYSPVAVNYSGSDKEIVRIVNIMGEDVDRTYNGIKIYVYSDGTSEKIVSVHN